MHRRKIERSLLGETIEANWTRGVTMVLELSFFLAFFSLSPSLSLSRVFVFTRFSDILEIVKKFVDARFGNKHLLDTFDPKTK